MTFGGKAWVNPAVSEIMAEVGRDAPHFTPDGTLVRAARRERMLGVLLWALIAAAVAASYAADALGRSALSWSLDGAAVAVQRTVSAA